MTYDDYLKTEHWRELRSLKLAQNPRCERCSDRLDLEVHHRLYRQTWFQTRLQDLETLCHACHNLHHVSAGNPAIWREIKRREQLSRPSHLTPYSAPATPIFKPSEKTLESLFPWKAHWPTEDLKP